ncbi:hypothetical protein AAH678_01640 [Sodalis endosymbiont of Spalangia cameroni]|uniref:hypothetical protein n=1 Tax=Sodalis praecaptivus TaxID=1239307 RepID=UPI0031F7A2B7
MIADVNRSFSGQPLQNASATRPRDGASFVRNMNQVSNNTEKPLPAKICKRRMAVSSPTINPKMVYQQQIGNIKLDYNNTN